MAGHTTLSEPLISGLVTGFPGQMYHVSVQPIATNILAYVYKHGLLKAGDRVGVAVSGGADSVALLRLLLDLRSEIGIVLSAVHFNHQLRGAASDADAQFVADLAQHHELDLHHESGDTRAYAAQKHMSIETAARELRYQYFRRLLTDAHFNRLATAHTLDDQAETVILKMTRGAGTRGLAGIYPRLRTAVPENAIIRPLLATQRKDLEVYLSSLHQAWREDASNRDLRHARNRVRHGILPRLERFLNPAVREALAETAEIARAEEDYWQGRVARLLPQLWSQDSSLLNSSALLALPLALQRRAVRSACESLGLRLELHHVEEILALAASRAKSTELPGGWAVLRTKQGLRLERRTAAAPSDYEYHLLIPGSTLVPEIHSRFEVVLVPRNRGEEYNADHLLSRALLSKELCVRNWRPGDRFWPAHTKAPKKIKQLLPSQAGAGRRLWPVVISGCEVVWVRGFPTPAKVRPRTEADKAILIREVPLE
ncbi:MAG: tRNA lysidine(34) synthetase TilS [Terriglobales bacterium]